MPSADPKTTRARARACVILILTTLRCRIRISDSTPTQKWAFAPECSRFRSSVRVPLRRAPPPRPPAGHAAGPGPATGRVRGASETERGTGGVTLEGARHTRCPGSPSRPDFVLFRLTKPKPHGWNPTEFLQRGATEPRRRVGPTHRTYAKMRAHTALAFRAGPRRLLRTAHDPMCGTCASRISRFTHRPRRPSRRPIPPAPKRKPIIRSDHTDNRTTRLHKATRYYSGTSTRNGRPPPSTPTPTPRPKSADRVKRGNVMGRAKCEWVGPSVNGPGQAYGSVHSPHSSEHRRT